MRKLSGYLNFLGFLLNNRRVMARKAKIEKWKREKIKPKYKTRYRNRCRICFRQLAWQGLIPGVKKASW